MVDPLHFDGMADRYATARPPYPQELWRDVRSTGLLGPGRRALDLGAGSGEATRELVAAGMDVVAVEPGPNLAAILQRRLPSVTVVRSRAEDLRVDDGAFDLAVAATSIHWMDLDIVLPLLHRALKPTGRFLVWRNVFGDAAADITPFRRAVHRIVERRGTTRPGNTEDADATAARLGGTGLFAVDGIHHYRWSVTLTTAQVRALFATFSDWTPAEVEEAASAAAELGGAVTEHYTSWLISALPVDIPSA
ncbi:class I SAM-dependent methyltransferase [Microbacterium kyungheense]|uniref:Methyltransferase family protein n=1 Tax=Microbacterium kyungheense TaxID=1263636 RepID=A0A543F3F3_9MICO|nr:class I SAM-dependent methyltransferase [Microbacterium kyungheense]TQM28363.1 methyltransferase family protein [Microbacterium kyungheense]